MLEINKIHQGDCIELLRQIPDNSIDLVIVDPPYNISKENDNRDRSKLNSPIMRRESPLKYDFGEWDNKTRVEFLDFTRTWLFQCCRVLKDGGTIISFFNKEDISYLGWEAKPYGIRTRTIFTWCKSNPVPSFRKVNYLSATEYLWIGSKGTKAWTFNFKMQDQTKNFAKTLTTFKTITDWCNNAGFRLFECVIYHKYGAEGAWWNKRFRVDHEYMPIFLKGERPQYFNKEPLKIPSKHGGKVLTGGATRLTNGKTLKARPIHIKPTKCRGTIWDYLTAGDGTKLKHLHPATFPDKIPYDFIQCFCPPNGVVLDVFMGSGTTALAAVKLNRNFLGFDISKEYVELAKKRLNEEANYNQKKLKSD